MSYESVKNSKTFDADLDTEAEPDHFVLHPLISQENKTTRHVYRTDIHEFVQFGTDPQKRIK